MLIGLLSIVVEYLQVVLIDRLQDGESCQVYDLLHLKVYVNRAWSKSPLLRHHPFLTYEKAWQVPARRQMLANVKTTFKYVLRDVIVDRNFFIQSTNTYHN